MDLNNSNIKKEDDGTRTSVVVAVVATTGGGFDLAQFAYMSDTIENDPRSHH